MIFDYDGVIFNSGPAVRRAVDELFAELGLDAPQDNEWKRWLGPSIAESLERTLREQGVDNANASALSAWYFDRLTQSSREIAHAFAGTVELVQDLMHAKVPVGIATMKAQTEMRELEGTLPAIDIVDVVVAPPDHHGGFSKKQMVGEVIARLGQADNDNGWMVGDRSSDIEAGHAHGLRTVAVTWGAGSRAELEAAKAEHIVDTVDELRALLLA